MKRLDKVPVFLHIPKNAGSYMIYMLQLFFNKNFRRIIKGNENVNTMRRIEIHDRSVQMIMYCLMNDNYFLIDSNMEVPDNCAYSRCKLATFKNYIVNGNGTLLTIIIKPSTTDDLRESWFSAWRVLDWIDAEPLNHMFLREPFARHQSLYNYLTSEKSAHEETHGLLTSKTFVDHIMSNQLEDSWLIRGLTGMPRNSIIDDYWYKQAVDFININNINTTCVKNIDSVFEHIYQSQHQKSFNDVVKFYKQTLKDEIEVNSNKNKREMITIHDLSDDVAHVFNEKTKWDQLLYDTLANNSAST